ncbi:hypothetical protein OS242_05910 [Tumebacillus sp. DT12]|uniref:Glycosyltransferase 2-like domain-containing protein n=1 Tax=Tumebacillus lacus TaxID=2995335 RepID=A0ABT3WXV4_9BACL|nr:hypothetical protein [Tumebacillus lacus]MCX7569490.1 hypothetical protein [Tumebacillus lacus]
MLALLIWGFALYGLFIVVWKLLRHWMIQSRRGVPVTAILIVREGASYIEGLLRTLTTAEPFVGRDLEVFVVDCGSQDETARIVEAISSKRYTVRLLAADGDAEGQIAGILRRKGRGVQCVFDLRSKMRVEEVVPTLAAFWSDEPA